MANQNQVENQIVKNPLFMQVRKKMEKKQLIMMTTIFKEEFYVISV